MPSGLQRCHAVINEPGGAAPYRNISVFEAQAPHGIRTAFTAPQKSSGNAKRDGDNRRPGIPLVTILVQAELRSGDVTIDQASIRIVRLESSLGSGKHGQSLEGFGHWRPRTLCFRIRGTVPITGPI